jgi:hypothetical protein
VLHAGGHGAVTDPVISFDGEWVIFSRFHDLRGQSMWSPSKAGADIYKLHLKTRKLVRLTHQELTPNTGTGDWASDPRKPEKDKVAYPFGTLNLGPYPLPGGRIVFTSGRDGFASPKHACPVLQLFVMDDDGSNVECIGHLNLGMALHPVTLKDGRVIFSTLEGQAQRNGILWGLWSIHPDGTNWGPVVSAFDLGWAPNAFHFQSQLSDGGIIAQLYYNQNNSGFGTFFKLPPTPPDGYPQFLSAHTGGKRDPKMSWRGGGYSLPFQPRGMEVYTRFAHGLEGPSPRLDPKDKQSPHTGKVTHPSGAPDNTLLCVWSPGPVNHQYTYLPQYDGGIYLLKSGGADDPREMRLIKNDPKYNEQFPRAVVPYERIYGVKEPAVRQPLANDGKLSPHLPEGTPFGLVGTSSLYKRESYPNGVVPEGKVTAEFAGGNDPWKGLDPFTSHGNGPARNWNNQGSDVGLYTNDDIHAIRIVAMEPTSYHTKNRFYNHAHERLRILGEIPVRKFTSDAKGGGASQPRDPDGHPDTSFLAKIPADVGFTFQTLDKDGLMLNMAQTWHQVRPGEVRTDCGGCHAHSQQPTLFEKTAAARPDYKLFDLTKEVPILTSKAKDESNRQWDAKDESGLRFVRGALDVEYHRDIKPILARSCVACHTARDGKEPAGKLNLDADDEEISIEYRGKVPGTYYRLAVDNAGKFGHPSIWGSGGYGNLQASRYIRKWQARRSLLVWKILGRRTDGWTNDDHPTETTPGDIKTLMFKGEPLADTYNHKARADLDYTGSPMPPPEAVKAGRVQPLSDEDRRTIFRWIDLGCPLDRDSKANVAGKPRDGWFADDKRPTLTMPLPAPGRNAELTRILIGMDDYYSGIDPNSFSVTADFAIDGAQPGTDLAKRFQPKSPGVVEWRIANPPRELKRGTITVRVKDRAGNLSRIDRTITLGGK